VDLTFGIKSKESYGDFAARMTLNTQSFATVLPILDGKNWENLDEGDPPLSRCHGHHERRLPKPS